MARLRRLLPRFSLRTLVVFLLLVTSSTALWSAFRRNTWAETKVLRGHRDCVYGAQFSPDGTRLTTWSLDETKRTWDVKTGECLSVLEYGPLALPPRGRASLEPSLLAEAQDDCTVVISDPETGERLQVLKGHSRPVYLVKFSGDGERLVTAGRDRTARVWKAATGECLGVLEGHDGHVLCAEFSRDGRRIVTGGFDGGTFIWDASNCNFLGFVASMHRGPFRDVTLALPSAYLRRENAGLEGTDRFAALIVGAENRQDLEWLQVSGIPVYAVAFSPDGLGLVSAGMDYLVHIHRRVRPEWWWGVFCLWEFWLAVVFAGLFVWSVWRDRRVFRHPPSPLFGDSAQANARRKS